MVVVSNIYFINSPLQLIPYILWSRFISFNKNKRKKFQQWCFHDNSVFFNFFGLKDPNHQRDYVFSIQTPICLTTFILGLATIYKFNIDFNEFLQCSDLWKSCVSKKCWHLSQFTSQLITLSTAVVKLMRMRVTMVECIFLFSDPILNPIML